MADVVVDASALVDLLVGTAVGPTVDRRLRGHRLFAPAHLDAEVLSALGRLRRAGRLSAAQVTARLRRMADAPLQRQPLPPLLSGAWHRRHNLRLVDALYVELAAQLGSVALVTTDGGLAGSAPGAELVTA